MPSYASFFYLSFGNRKWNFLIPSLLLWILFLKLYKKIVLKVWLHNLVCCFKLSLEHDTCIWSSVFMWTCYVKSGNNWAVNVAELNCLSPIYTVLVMFLFISLKATWCIISLFINFPVDLALFRYFVITNKSVALYAMKSWIPLTTMSRGVRNWRRMACPA